MSQAPDANPPAAGPPAVGATLQQLRQARKLSLDELSRHAGVSKSMLSQIERNQANPTVAILWRLANALGIELTEFLASGQPARPVAAVQLVPANAIPVISSPDGHCTLRILGPIELAGRLEWYELSVAPGGELVSEAHEQGTREHLSVLGGSLLVEAAGGRQKLRSGETARYAADVSHAIRNPGKTTATALLVVEHGS